MITGIACRTPIKPTRPAIQTIKAGPIIAVTRCRLTINVSSRVSANYSKPWDMQIFSICARSTINLSNWPLRAIGCAMVLPSVTPSRVISMAFWIALFWMTFSVIRRAVSTGTPFCNSAPSVRDNCPNKFGRTTVLINGAVSSQLSKRSRPSSGRYA